MELSEQAIQDVVHPTAAFAAHDGPHLHPTTDLPSALLWDDSLLNPKNRIDSLDVPQQPLWRVDGCSNLGTQYYLVPLFFSDVSPLRIDVYIPDSQPPELRRQLDLQIAFHTKDGSRLAHLGITRFIVRLLGHWVRTQFEDLAACEKFYRSVPFGTRLVLEKLSSNIRDVEVRVALNHDLERRLLSLATLKQLWGADFPFPNVVDIHEVQVVRVIHDSVCLARIRGELVIFKALMGECKYLYHELKTLCTLNIHPNVIAHPIHLVKKVCDFGGKSAIVGFTTFYHCNGSLRDILPQFHVHGRLDRTQQLKWCIQLTKALEDLRYSSNTYYPDLRLDNIVLSSTWDIVMVDFEQRGVWCEFAAPEVNSLEYIRLIATDDRMDEHLSTLNSEEDRLFIHEKYRNIMRRLVPEFDVLEDSRYTNPPHGYNVPWIALSPLEQEAAEVYMLGRVLWCIFEGVSGPQKAAVWQSYPWESDLEFPEFRRTPHEMRMLIDACTRGRRQTLGGSTIVREGSRLVLKGVPSNQQTPKDVQDAARLFWQRELEIAEQFLMMRDELKSQGRWVENYHGRPTLKQVLADLTGFQHDNHS